MVAYLDESGNSLKADTITMSGVVARARDWKRLQKHWPRAMKGFPLPYHHTDFLDRQNRHLKAGDTESADEYDALQQKLIATLSDVEYFGFGVSVIRKDWDVVKDRFRRKDRFKNPWYLVFETAIGEILARTEEEFAITESISFVVDRIDGVSEHALQVYEEILALGPEKISYHRRLGPMAFATGPTKPKMYPLQAADLFTYEANRYVRDTVVKEIEPKRWQWKALNDGRPPRAINGRIFRPDTLEDLAQLVEQDRLAEIAAFQRRMEMVGE